MSNNGNKRFKEWLESIGFSNLSNVYAFEQIADSTLNFNSVFSLEGGIFTLTQLETIRKKFNADDVEVMYDGDEFDIEVIGGAPPQEWFEG